VKHLGSPQADVQICTLHKRRINKAGTKLSFQNQFSVPVTAISCTCFCQIQFYPKCEKLILKNSLFNTLMNKSIKKSGKIPFAKISYMSAATLKQYR